MKTKKFTLSLTPPGILCTCVYWGQFPQLPLLESECWGFFWQLLLQKYIFFNFSRYEGPCSEKQWNEREDYVYFVLRGESVHCFFTLRSLGQLCPVLPRFKKLPSLPGVNKRDSTSFFRMSWSNKNKKHISFIKQSKCMNFIILLTFYIILYKIRKKCKTKRNIHICCNFFFIGRKKWRQNFNSSIKREIIYWTVDGTKCYYVKGEKKVKLGKMLNFLCIIFADACFNFIKTVWSAQERNAHTVGHLDDRCNYLWYNLYYIIT